MVLCCCSPSATKFWCFVCSEMLIYVPWLQWVVIWVTIAFLAGQNSVPILFWHQEGISARRTGWITGCLLFYWLFFVNSRDGWAGKSTVSEIHRSACLEPKTMPNHASLKSSFFLMLSVNLSRSYWPALSSCSVTSREDICLNKQVNRYT